MVFKRARSFADLEKEHNELQRGIKESKGAYEAAKNARDIKEAEVKEHTERIEIQIRKLQAQLEQYLADADPELRNLQNHYSVQSASVRNCEQELRNFNNKLRASVEPDDQQLPPTPATASPIRATSARPGQLSQQLSPPTSNSSKVYNAPSTGGTPALSRKRAQQNIYEVEEGESGPPSLSHEERYKGRSSSNSPTHGLDSLADENSTFIDNAAIDSDDNEPEDEHDEVSEQNPQKKEKTNKRKRESAIGTQPSAPNIDHPTASSQDVKNATHSTSTNGALKKPRPALTAPLPDDHSEAESSIQVAIPARPITHPVVYNYQGQLWELRCTHPYCDANAKEVNGIIKFFNGKEDFHQHGRTRHHEASFSLCWAGYKKLKPQEWRERNRKYREGRTKLIPLIPEKEPEKNTALKTPSRKGTAEPSAQSSKGPRNMRSKTPIGNSMGELTAQLSKSKSKKKEEKEKRSSSTWRTTVGMDT